MGDYRIRVNDASRKATEEETNTGDAHTQGDDAEAERIKEHVRRKYSGIVSAEPEGKGSCCGPSKGNGPGGGGGDSNLSGDESRRQTGACCGSAAGEAGTIPYSMIGDSYEGLAGHEADADYGLGCGLPTKLAAIAPGETVVDLGSGAGNDAFVARAEVGAEGRVIGIDFVQEMVGKAREIAARRGYTNVEFRLGEIEKLPVEANEADIVISNCVLNLVPDKARAFAEMHRIIKPGGRFCVSDIVVDGELPPAVRASLEAYAGCVSGALERSRYLALLQEAGFTEVGVAAEHRIDAPEEILRKELTEAEVAAFCAGNGSVTSVTVRGRKP